MFRTSLAFPFKFSPSWQLYRNGKIDSCFICSELSFPFQLRTLIWFCCRIAFFFSFSDQIWMFFTRRKVFALFGIGPFHLICAQLCLLRTYLAFRSSFWQINLHYLQYESLTCWIGPFSTFSLSACMLMNIVRISLILSFSPFPFCFLDFPCWIGVELRLHLTIFISGNFIWLSNLNLNKVCWEVMFLVVCHEIFASPSHSIAFLGFMSLFHS